MTTYTLRKGAADKTRADVVVVAVTTDAKGPRVAPGGEPVAAAYGRRFAPLLASVGVSGAVGDCARVPTAGTLTAGSLVLVGIGPRGRSTPQVLRRAAGSPPATSGTRPRSPSPCPPPTPSRWVPSPTGSSVPATPTRASTPPGARSKDGVAEVAILSEAARRKDCVQALTRAEVLGRYADLVRDLVNTPPNLLPPAELAERVRGIDTRKKSPVKVSVLDESELAELGCGGILGVGQGSDNPPRLVRLEYRPKGASKDTPHVALVGKGITYDSGGLTIKPGSSMATMKNDMAGAATAVAATYALAELEAPVAITTWAPMAENMVSGRAYRPGDVLTMYDGQTVEVKNTDAEGRLVLADALAMAAESGAGSILEISTLTGPCVVALGDRVAGLFGDDDMVRRVERAAERAGELVWHLPMLEETRERVRTESTVADLLQHNWVRFGGASWAAAFLSAFVGDTPFAHIDMAGPAWNGGGPWGHVPSGATGFGVATLVEAVLATARDDGRASVEAVAAALLAVLTAVVLAHPVGHPDQPRVVRRDGQAVAEVVGPAHRRDPATGPLAVEGDQQQGVGGDGGPGLDEPLDALALGRPLAQVHLVAGLRLTHGGRPAALEPVEDAHA